MIETSTKTIDDIGSVSYARRGSLAEEMYAWQFISFPKTEAESASFSSNFPKWLAPNVRSHSVCC